MSEPKIKLKMKTLVLILIFSRLSTETQAAVFEVHLSTIKWSITLENVEEEDFRNVTKKCKEVLEEPYKKAMETISSNKCKTSATVFQYSDKLKTACNSNFYDRKLHKMWTKAQFAEMRDCVQPSLPGCTLTNFYWSCWMGQIHGLHHIPPFITDITSSDVHLFDRKFKYYSAIKRKNICCLVNRAETCFEKFDKVECRNLEKHCFGFRGVADNYMEYLNEWVNLTYFAGIEEALHCKKSYMPEEVCVFSSCGLGFALSGFLWFLILLIIKV